MIVGYKRTVSREISGGIWALGTQDRNPCVFNVEAASVEGKQFSQALQVSKDVLTMHCLPWATGKLAVP